MKKPSPLRVLIAAALMTCVLNACSISPGSSQLKERQVKAQAMFAERCKTAGEKIYRTADNVEGVYLMKIRTTTNFGAQFRLDDPYGSDSTGEMYLMNFLKGFYHQQPSKLIPGAPPQVGYLYVAAKNPEDGQLYRYTGGMKVVGRMDPAAPNVQVDLKRDPNFDLNVYRFGMDRTPALGPLPRYGVTFDDISTREEREYWIAGSSLKVIDLQTNEVIAERVGYMMDWAQGNTASGRSPWLFAADHACPGFQRNPYRPITQNYGGGASAQAGQTLFFVEKVLKPLK